jgi:hypothetical protein
VNNYLEGKMDGRQPKRDDPYPLLETVMAVRQYLVTDPHHTFDDCIRWARLKFEPRFNFPIRDLQVTSRRTGRPKKAFGSGLTASVSRSQPCMTVAIPSTRNSSPLRRFFELASEGEATARIAAVRVRPGFRIHAK